MVKVKVEVGLQVESAWEMISLRVFFQLCWEHTAVDRITITTVTCFSLAINRLVQSSHVQVSPRSLSWITMAACSLHWPLHFIIIHFKPSHTMRPGELTERLLNLKQDHTSQRWIIVKCMLAEQALVYQITPFHKRLSCITDIFGIFIKLTPLCSPISPASNEQNFSSQ